MIAHPEGAGPVSEDQLRTQLPVLFDVGHLGALYGSGVRRLRAEAPRTLASAISILREAVGSEDLARLEAGVRSAMATIERGPELSAIRWTIFDELDLTTAPQKAVVLTRTVRVTPANVDDILRSVEEAAHCLDLFVRFSRTIEHGAVEGRAIESKIRQLDSHIRTLEEQCARLQALRLADSTSTGAFEAELERRRTDITNLREKSARKRVVLEHLHAGVRRRLELFLRFDESAGGPEGEAPSSAPVSPTEGSLVQMLASLRSSLEEPRVGHYTVRNREAEERARRSARRKSLATSVGLFALLGSIGIGAAYVALESLRARAEERVFHGDGARTLVRSGTGMESATLQHELQSYQAMLLQDPFLARRLPHDAREAIAGAQTFEDAQLAYADGFGRFAGFGVRGAGDGLLTDLDDVLKGENEILAFDTAGSDEVRVSLVPAALEALERAYGRNATPKLQLVAGRGPPKREGPSTTSFARTEICDERLSMNLSMDISFPPGLPLKGISLSTTVHREDLAHLSAICRSTHAGR